MSSNEINKIVGAVLFTLLVVVGASVLAKMVYAPEGHGTPGHDALEAGVVASDQEGAALAALPDDPAAAAVTSEEQPRAIPFATLLAGADPEAGRKVAKKCAACHTLDEGGAKKIGPNLWNVLGRPVAGLEGFNYSDALKGRGGIWGYDELAGFLTKPKAYAPGTKMAFVGIKKESDLAALIAFIRSLSNAPLPLPEKD